MSLATKIEEAVLPVIAENNFELVDVECVSGPGRMIVRIYVDKKTENAPTESYSSKITMDDCQLVSEKVPEILDKGNIVGDYILEVSSPGIYRRIRKPEDFLRFLNQRIRVRTYEPVDGQRNFTGYIRKFEENNLSVETLENKSVTIEIEKIAHASLYPEIKI